MGAGVERMKINLGRRKGRLNVHAPDTWVDAAGVVRRTPRGRFALQARIPSHLVLREFVIARDGKCQWCGRLDDLVADHIISVRNGGAHHPLNLQALCQSCNSSKSNLVDRVRR